MSYIRCTSQPKGARMIQPNRDTEGVVHRSKTEQDLQEQVDQLVAQENEFRDRITHLERLIWEIQEKQKFGKIVEFEYEHVPTQRPIGQTEGGKRLLQMVASRSASYVTTIEQFARYMPDLLTIQETTSDSTAPFWTNGWFPVLDAISLYGFLRARKPLRYIEVGSGNSTKFARRAITDGGLDTKIISIDPYPRAEIDDICDQVIRSKLENFDFSSIGGLTKDDILFIDSSHRVSQGNDVAVFFTEILPALPPGMIYGMHDIMLPESDYPASWLDRHYGEQYLLAAYLSGGANRDQILFPAYFLTARKDTMLSAFQPLFSSDALNARQEHIYGFSFWFRRHGGTMKSKLARMFRRETLAHRSHGE